MRDVRGEAPCEMGDLAHGPAGGRGKQWFAGMVLAALPVIYGVYSIQRGYTTMFGSRGASAKISGSAGLYLAVAYIAIGAFFHFHYFWGLSERLWRFSQALKVISLLVFLPAFAGGMYLAFV
jgi:hypothetical protein